MRNVSSLTPVFTARAMRSRTLARAVSPDVWPSSKVANASSAAMGSLWSRNATSSGNCAAADWGSPRSSNSRITPSTPTLSSLSTATVQSVNCDSVTPPNEDKAWSKRRSLIWIRNPGTPSAVRPSEKI